MIEKRRLATSRTGVIIFLMICSPAHAQSYVRPDCKPLITSAPPTDPLTARWYRRFWTGDCSDLHGCIGGSPNWNDVIGKLVARSDVQERGAVLVKACRLGTLIGLEWTRPRNVRRIDSGDLQGFKATLESSGDVLSGIEQVARVARAKAGG